jgi:hypothetical protein
MLVAIWGLVAGAADVHHFQALKLGRILLPFLLAPTCRCFLPVALKPCDDLAAPALAQ